MSVTEEAGGRLNAYAKEPKMEVIKQTSTLSSSLIIVAGAVLVIGLITFTVRIS